MNRLGPVSLESFARIGIREFCRAAGVRRLDVTVEGLELVPPAGPVLLAGRHYHHFYDAAILLTRIPRPLHFLVALDWVHAPRERRLMEWACRAARWPVLLRAEQIGPTGAAYRPDEVGPYLRRAIGEAVGLLRDGHALVVFPEGYPTVDPAGSVKTGTDAFLPFRSGFARLVARAQRGQDRPIPIVPFGLAYRPGPREQALLRIGAPTHLEMGVELANLAREVEIRVREVEARVRELSNHVPSPSGRGLG